MILNLQRIRNAMKLGIVLVVSILLSELCGAQTQEVRIFTINDGDARIREWNISTGAFLGDAGLLTSGGESFGRNTDIATDGRYFYTIASGDARIRKFDLFGHFVGDATALKDSFGPVTNQIGLAIDGPNYLTIGRADPRIRQFDFAGNYVKDLATLKDSNGVITDQTGIDTDGQYFYTIASGDSRVRKFDLAGNFIGDLFSLTDGGSSFGNSTGIVFLFGLHLTIRVSQVELCWNTITNRQYQVQFRTGATSNLWSELGSPLSGSGIATCVLDLVPPGEPQRFYRVVTVP